MWLAQLWSTQENLNRQLGQLIGSECCSNLLTDETLRQFVYWFSFGLSLAHPKGSTRALHVQEVVDWFIVCCNSVWYHLECVQYQLPSLLRSAPPVHHSRSSPVSISMIWPHIPSPVLLLLLHLKRHHKEGLLLLAEDLHQVGPGDIVHLPAVNWRNNTQEIHDKG